MPQFAALHRKDNQSVRYLVVDDSVFARKNLIKMIEMFGGEVGGRSRRRLDRHRGIQPHQSRHRPYGHHHAADGRHRSGRAHHSSACRCAHRDGLVRRLSGKYSRRFAKGREALRPKTRQARSPVRNFALRAQRRPDCGWRSVALVGEQHS